MSDDQKLKEQDILVEKKRKETVQKDSDSATVAPLDYDNDEDLLVEDDGDFFGFYSGWFGGGLKP